MINSILVLKGFGIAVIPETKSVTWGCSSDEGSTENVIFCNRVVKYRNISALARVSPGHCLLPFNLTEKIIC